MTLTLVVLLLLMATLNQKKKSFNKKKLAVILVVILLLIGSGVAAYYYYSRINDAKDTATEEKTVDEKIATIVSSAEGSGDARTQKQELKQLADEETDKEKKAEYQSATVDLYINTDDKQGAIEAAKTYENSNESALSAAAVAKTYEDVKDFKNAAKYYGIAAKRSPKPASPEERAPYNDYILQKQAMEARL